MIVPSIDIQGGRAVQLIGGETLAIDAGDPRPLLERFGIVGEVAVIDLDAARGEGSNARLIEELVRMGDCRVGGGIRDYESASRWLDAGASKIIIGTAAEPGLLFRLPRERVIAAVDGRDGEAVVEGWRRRAGARVEERIGALREFAGGFLVTFVEREGRMTGLPMEHITRLVELAGDARLTAAGGARSAGEIGQADRAGADVQVGMALYSGAMSLGAAMGACLRSDRPDGLWPTIVCDESGRALGLAYSNPESLERAIADRSGVYWSRSRRTEWRKGETSGDSQVLLRVDLDCDRDAIRFTVHQDGRGFCHKGTSTCFGASRGLAALQSTIEERLGAGASATGSYTARLLAQPGLLEAKLREEAGELAQCRERREAVDEAADLAYFMLTKMASVGASLSDVEDVLDRRARRITRRAGDAKPGRTVGA